MPTFVVGTIHNPQISQITQRSCSRTRPLSQSASLGEICGPQLHSLRLGAFARGPSSLDAKRKPWTQVGRKPLRFASKNKWIRFNDLAAGNTALDGLDAKLRTWSERDKANSQSTDFTDYADGPLGESPAFSICVNRRNLRTTGRIALRLRAVARDHSSLDAKRMLWTQVGRKPLRFASKNKWIGFNDLTAGNTALDGLDAKLRTWSERDKANSQSTDFTDYADGPLVDSPASQSASLGEICGPQLHSLRLGAFARDPSL